MVAGGDCGSNTGAAEVKASWQRGLTRVITPMRSSSLLGLRGTRLGVEFPEPGGEPAHSVGGMELMERKRPPRPSLPPTRHSISSARMAVLSFSSWIILQVEHGSTTAS